jgi:hypothetical protein
VKFCVWIVEIHPQAPQPRTNMVFLVVNIPNLTILVEEKLEKIVQIEEKK